MAHHDRRLHRTKADSVAHARCWLWHTDAPPDAYGEAARWFETYLAERPSGPFAREALGRLLECRKNGGSRASARAVAERYIALYPSGPHAPLAKQLLAEAEEH